MTHGTFSATDLDRNMPTPLGRRAQNAALYQSNFGGEAYSCFPPYHLAGVQAFTILPIFYGSTTVFGPPDIPATGLLASEIMQKTDLTSIYVPPAVIEEWVQRPEALEQAAKLDFVLYGSGPLSPSTGNLLDEVCNLCQVHGSTEIGKIQLLVPLKGNWAYLEPNPCEELDMQEFEDQEAYEMVLHQNSALNHRRSLHHNFPDYNTWRTGDLFLPHPEKLGLWSFYGRVDELIILSDSHKINPVPLTGEKNQGHGSDDLVERIWPTIEKVNRSTPAYGQILRSMVILSSVNKPFVRAPKGSVVRSLTLERYSEEMENIYAEGSFPAQTVTNTIEDINLSTIKQSLYKSVMTVLPGDEISDNVDLFHSGLDSLKVSELKNIIHSGLRGKKINRQCPICDKNCLQASHHSKPSKSDL